LDPSDESKPVVILIVEDEMIVRMSTTDILQDAGYLVLEARDGVEAIAMIELRDDVAALFTDVTMPNMNGVALARVVRERWPHIGIVVTSGALPPNVKLELPEGARFLAKPYKPKELLQDIQAVLPRSVQQWRSGACPRCKPASCTAQTASLNLCQSPTNDWCGCWARPITPPRCALSVTPNRPTTCHTAGQLGGEFEFGEVRMTITLFDPRTGRPVTITVPDRPSPTPTVAKGEAVAALRSGRPKT
jgi:two-component system, response regulator PdtaR